jgi:hypothetical protein
MELAIVIPCMIIWYWYYRHDKITSMFVYSIFLLLANWHSMTALTLIFIILVVTLVVLRDTIEANRYRG